MVERPAERAPDPGGEGVKGLTALAILCGHFLLTCTGFRRDSSFEVLFFWLQNTYPSSLPLSVTTRPVEEDPKDNLQPYLLSNRS